MAYYSFIGDNKIIGKGQCLCSGPNLLNVEISENVYHNLEKYMWNGEEIVLDSEYGTKMLMQAKSDKHSENINKAQLAISNGYIVFKNAQFETNTQTCFDMTTTMLIMKSSEIDTYSWVSKDDKVIELSLDDFSTIIEKIALFKNNIWNNLYTTYKYAIDSSTTIQELNNIVINYEDMLYE